MYSTDRGIEELVERRGDESVTLAYLADRLSEFVDLNPAFEGPIERLATWLARDDSLADDPMAEDGDDADGTRFGAE